MTDNTEQNKEKDFFDLRHQIIWAMLGAVLLLNSFLARFLFADGGVNSAVCAALSLIFLVPPLLKIVYDDFKHKRVHMNELVLIAVVAGISRGDFLTAGLIAFFMLIGLIIESRSASGAKESLEMLTRMTPGKARKVLEDGSTSDVDPETLVPGDVIQVRPGETLLADGNIKTGRSSLQEANITGESLPVDKQTGDSVFAGTINLTGALEVTVSKAGENTTLGKVKELILAAESTRPKFIRMIDSYAGYYSPLVLILAFFVWAVSGHDMQKVVAVLVAACPIALVLSTPSAAVAALSVGARLGVLIKKVSDIEAFSTITSFIFDKTGTLTTGNLEVTSLAPCKGVKNNELLLFAASAEQHSNHPVAKAVCHLAQKARVTLVAAEDIHEEAGRGIRGAIKGSSIFIGNLAWMEENGIKSSEFPDFTAERKSGMSLLFVLKDGKAFGWISLEDKPRPGAAECIQELKENGIQYTAIVSGDHNSVAARVAGELKVNNYFGECVPSDKISKVHQIKEMGHKTVFVGDGVNDAPALAASDISIAMGAAGSDVAIETATIALLNNELNRLPFLLQLAKGYRGVMFQNFALGALFITGGMIAGACGYLTAVPAAFLQAASAVVVVMNSARLIRSGEDLK